MVFSTIIKAGRVGIMTSTALLMEDIRLLSPTHLSTTPRYITVAVLVRIFYVHDYISPFLFNNIVYRVIPILSLKFLPDSL